MSTQVTSSKTSAAPKLALVAIIALVIAGLTTVDRFLSTAQDVEAQRLAKRSHLDGLRFLQTGRNNQAVEAFRKAHAIERRNTEYELELIDALIAAGKPDQAELLVRDVLEREPNNGHANLLGAHLMIAEERTAEAESYYHRAIYGEWPGDAEAHRVSVRMELADFLAARGQREELLAELLPLQEEVGKNAAIRLHLAQLFLVAGSASRAADEYRAVVKQDSKDAAAQTGLGQAELQLGEYHLAHKAFVTAASYKPEDLSIRRLVDLSDTLAGLDPTSRRLPSMEKYHRSLRILGLAQAALESCVALHLPPDTGETSQLLTSANEVLTGEPPEVVTNELSETVLGIAEKMWKARIKVCGGVTSPEEEPLRLIVERLAQ